MKPTTALAIVALAMPFALQAQTDNRPGGDRQARLPGGLDSFLMLTPDQLMKLRQHQQETLMAVQEISRQAAATRRMLNEALRADPVDNAAVGALFVQIGGLQRQLAELRQRQRQGAADALGLTMEQRDKLGALQSALALQAPAQAALRLNLIGPARGPVDNSGEPRDGGPVDGQNPAILVPMRGPEGGADAEALHESISQTLDAIDENVRRLAERFSVVAVSSGDE